MPINYNYKINTINLAVNQADPRFALTDLFKGKFKHSSTSDIVRSNPYFSRRYETDHYCIQFIGQRSEDSSNSGRIKTKGLNGFQKIINNSKKYVI